MKSLALSIVSTFGDEELSRWGEGGVVSENVSNVNVRSTLRGGGDRRNVCNTNVPVVLNGALCESIVHDAILGGAHGENIVYNKYSKHV